MSRVEWYLPAHQTWVWTASIWFVLQCVISGLFFGTHQWTWIVMGLCALYSFLIGRFFLVVYWPACLVFYPLMVLVGALSFISGFRFNAHRRAWLGFGVAFTWLFSVLLISSMISLFFWLIAYPAVILVFAFTKKTYRTWPRPFLTLTWGVGVIMLLIMNVSESLAEQRQAKMPLVDRILEHGARAAAFSEVRKMKDMGPQGLTMLREIVKKGDVQLLSIDQLNAMENHGTEVLHKGAYLQRSRVLSSGQEMLMGHAAEILLSNGDPETDVPLILDAIRRVEPKFKQVNQKPLGLHVALTRFLEEKHRVRLDPNASTEEYQKKWDEVRSQYSTPNQDRARILRQGGYTIHFRLIDAQSNKPLFTMPPYDLDGLDSNGKRLGDLMLVFDDPDSTGHFAIREVPGSVKGLYLRPDGFVGYESLSLKSDANGDIDLGDITLKRSVAESN